MSKIYLCGMTQNDAKNIEELTSPIHEFIDGLIFVDHGSTDGTRELLEERKGEGKIIDRPWVFQHDHSQNSFLLEGPLKPGDYFILRDSMERFNPEWAKNIRPFIDSLSTQGIRSVWNYGKGFIFQKNDGMFFQGNPHWALTGAQGGSIDLKTMFDENKKEHTWRVKDGEPGGRPFDNKINHEAKYAWTYGRSNHLLLGMENNIEMYQRAEIIRQRVRDYARLNDFSFDMDGLKKFMEWFQEVDPANFKVWINSHRVWKNFYRYRILGEDFYEIDKSEKEWVLG